MNDWPSFLEQAWNTHADNPAGVAARLPLALPMLQSEDDLLALLNLGLHVWGEHLGAWQPGLAWLQTLNGLPQEGERSRAALARGQACLLLCEGGADLRPTLQASDRCRCTAMAACYLGQRDAARAQALLHQACDDAAALPDGDPALRTLASFSNNLAGTLQELPQRSEAQTRLMLDAAERAHRTWARAGTWLEVERADYRLSLCWLAAGDPRLALRHAQRCDALVREHGSVPLEAFFAAEVLARAAVALGDGRALADARDQAERQFKALEPGDQGWCQATLDQVRGLTLQA